MPKEQIEECLESVFDTAGESGTAKTTEIARRLNVAPASVTELFQRMTKIGLVRYEPYRGVSLTKKGLGIACSVKRKHRLLEVFLARVLHMDKSRVHNDACKMEHAISDEAETALCKLLNAPKNCPHGKPIDPCKRNSCGKCVIGKHDGSSSKERNIIPMTLLKPSQKGLVAFLRGDQKVVQRLSDLGLIPATEVTLLRKAPMSGPIEVFIRRTTIAIAHDIAENIFVELRGSV